MRTCENANAKINLYLDITGKRADGYHDIVTLMQSVSLSDTLTIDASCSEATEISLAVEYDGAVGFLADGIPTDGTNLVARAASKYLDKAKITAKVNIGIVKRIPVGAGLGGGSSDAAATLRGLNKIFSALTESEIMELAAELGSDVPFCVDGGLALCEGRGEQITRLTSTDSRALVIAISKSRVSTPAAFCLLDEIYGDFKNRKPKITIDKRRIGQIPLSELGYNIFEECTDGAVREALLLKGELMRLGAKSALMTGSGPAVFGVFDAKCEAESAERILSSMGYATFVSSFIPKL